MRFEYTDHWFKKKKRNITITEDVLEYAIINSNELRDKYWGDALNAIVRFLPQEDCSKLFIRKKEKIYIR